MSEMNGAPSRTEFSTFTFDTQKDALEFRKLLIQRHHDINTHVFRRGRRWILQCRFLAFPEPLHPEVPNDHLEVTPELRAKMEHCEQALKAAGASYTEEDDKHDRWEETRLHARKIAEAIFSPPLELNASYTPSPNQPKIAFPKPPIVSKARELFGHEDDDER